MNSSEAASAPQLAEDLEPRSRAAEGEAAAARRPTQVIVFASQKGGSGKTTLCGQLAVQAELAGAGPVALIDTDPQGSLAAWWNSRRSGTPVFVKTELAYLTRDIEALEYQSMRFIFIDTPPTITDRVRQVIRHADLVVVPTRPSPHDLRAVGPTIDMVEDYGLPLVFVVNGATRARITGDVCVALSQHGTVAPVLVHQRVDFATSMIDGRTVMEIKGDSASAEEIAGVWRYLAERLARVERRAHRLAESGAARAAFGGAFEQAAFGRRRSPSAQPAERL